MLKPGVWEVEKWYGRIAIRNEAMPVDAAIELVGDFGSDKAKEECAEKVCALLNASEKEE